MFRPNFEKGDGLIVAIAQNWRTKDVLMQAFMNEEAWNETLRTGRMVYFSRSRNKLWEKGEESGHVQFVKEIRIDCDSDSVLFLVEQLGGAACHDGYRTCYYSELVDGELRVVEERVFDPKDVYKKGNE